LRWDLIAELPNQTFLDVLELVCFINLEKAHASVLPAGAEAVGKRGVNKRELDGVSPDVYTERTRRRDG
jgi:hypothetical protein